MYLLTLILFASSTLYSPESVINSAPAFSDKELASMQKGKIISREIPDSKKGKTFEAFTIFDFNKEKAVASISDFANYHRFMPNVEKIDILKQETNQATLNYYLGLPLGKKKRYRLELETKTLNEHTIISWKMIDWPGIPTDERIGDTTGFWQLTPFQENKTLVRYHVYTDPGDVPFGLGWIVDFMSERSLPQVLKSTRNYAKNN